MPVWVDIRPQAYLALLVWIPIGIVMFASMKPIKAGITALVLGVMLLPELAAFDPPALPPIDKMAVACLASYLGAMLLARRELARARFLRGAEAWFLLVIIGNIGTSLTNPDPVIIGGGIDYDGETRLPEITLQAMTKYDILSSTVRDVLGILLPFHLGRVLIRTREDALVMARVIAGTMLLLLPLMLFELRFSPQLHYWIYGYYALDFAHNMRGGGFKSSLFLSSGLAVAMFLMAGMFSLAMLRRAREKVAGFGAGVLLPVFWGMLLISRNVGANIYALAAMPLLLGRKVASAGRLAVVLSLFVIAFPSLRATQTFPADDLVAFAAKYSAARAQSLGFRFDNEDILLERANERQWFGWGGFGRNRVYDERGKDISVTDGEWIIRYGSRGVIGFVGAFGLLVWPIFMARRRTRRLADAEAVYVINALSLLTALHTLDLLPNGLFTVFPYFFAGALAGVCEGMGGPARGSPGAAIAPQPQAAAMPYPPQPAPPGAYPPGAYPPGAYPPGAYPPGAYPPGTHPSGTPGVPPRGP